MKKNLLQCEIIHLPFNLFILHYYYYDYDYNNTSTIKTIMVGNKVRTGVFTAADELLLPSSVEAAILVPSDAAANDSSGSAATVGMIR